MYGLSDFLRAVVMPRTTQRKGPKPIEIISSPNAQEIPTRGLSKYPQEETEDLLTYLDRSISKKKHQTQGSVKTSRYAKTSLENMTGQKMTTTYE